MSKFITVPPMMMGEVCASERLQVEVPCILLKEAWEWVDAHYPGWSLYERVERPTSAATLTFAHVLLDPCKEYHAEK